jgi:hypothetical protein
VTLCAEEGEMASLADDCDHGRQPTSHERLSGLPWDASYHDALHVASLGLPVLGVDVARTALTVIGPDGRMRPSVVNVGVLDHPINFDEYDRVMADDRRAAVLIAPERVFANG